jgi:hypothetical protein
LGEGGDDGIVEDLCPVRDEENCKGHVSTQGLKIFVLFHELFRRKMNTHPLD